jgi:hypothetical protein
LHITHRLPDILAELVDDFADYGGLTSAPEVVERRLDILNTESVDPGFKQIINPDDVVTWIDMRKSEETPYKESSWDNPQEAVVCAKICKNLVKLRKLSEKNSIVIITRFTDQVMVIRNLLAQMGLLENHNIKVTTTTTALGTQGDIESSTSLGRILVYSVITSKRDFSVGNS